MCVGGRSESGGAVGSSGVRSTVNGGCGQSSSAASGRIHGLSLGLVPCRNQSWIMNCSQAAISALPAVAGMISSRVISRRLTSRGFGSSIRSLSGQVSDSATLRPNRVPAMPISGWSRSFQLPSGCRSVRNRSSNGGGCTGFTDGSREVSTRFSSRRVFRMPISSTSPSGLGSSYQGCCWSMCSTSRSKARSTGPGRSGSSAVSVPVAGVVSVIESPPAHSFGSVICVPSGARSGQG